MRHDRRVRMAGRPTWCPHRGRDTRDTRLRRVVGRMGIRQAQSGPVAVAAVCVVDHMPPPSSTVDDRLDATYVTHVCHVYDGASPQYTTAIAP